MTVDTNAQNPQQNTSNEKELNFRKQQQMYEKMLAEKDARISELQQKSQAQVAVDDDDHDDEPYIDKRKLGKALSKERQTIKQETQSEIQNAVAQAIAQERKASWLKANSDFYEVMGHAQKFAETDPELAETILEMPDSFERQKLVYKNIKALGLHKPPEVKTTVQDTINQNRRSPYYQPSGMSSAPYGIPGTGGKDYSKAEMEQAHEKMKELKNRLRM
jgi:hypothetical protein